MTKMLVTFFFVVFVSAETLLPKRTTLFHDSISITDITLGLPQVGLGGSGLIMSSGFSESVLNPHELRIVQTPLLPFFGSSKLEYNSLSFEYSDLVNYDLDWKIITSDDASTFIISNEFTRQPPEVTIITSPFLVKYDTSSYYNYIHLRDKIGINVDTTKQSRLTIFTDSEDQYNSDAIGAVQVYKNAGEISCRHFSYR